MKKNRLRSKKSRKPLRLIVKLSLFAGVVLFLQRWWVSAPRAVREIQRLEQAAGNSLRLQVVGDTGSGEPGQFAVAAAMERRCLDAKPDAILMLGDTFYMAGVDSVADPQWDSKLFKVYGGPCLGQVPIYPVLGNHDYKGNVQAQIDKSAQEPRWHLPNRFYRVSFGNLLDVFAVDTEVFDFCGSPSLCTWNFLNHELSAPGATWRLALGHKPLASASQKHADEKWLGFALRSALCGKVDTYLAGHVHHLEHRRDDSCAVEQFIVGGGGATLYPIAPNETTKFARSQFGFLELEISAEKLTSRFLDTDALELYETTQTKP